MYQTVDLCSSIRGMLLLKNTCYNALPAYNVRQLNDLDLEFRNIIRHYTSCCSSNIS